MDALLLEGLGAADIIDVVRVTSINDDVTLLEPAHELLQRFFDNTGRDHHPTHAGLPQFGDVIVKRAGADGALLCELPNRLLVHVSNYAFVSFAQKSPNHIHAHS